MKIMQEVISVGENQTILASARFFYTDIPIFK